MVDQVIDRGGEIGPDPIPASARDGIVTRSGGLGSIAFIGAAIGLIGAISGLAIGYGTFHHPAASKAADQPAKASDRSVDDVMASPAAQRAALANQLGQQGFAQTDMLGRPIASTAEQPPTDASGGTVMSNDQQTPEQRRAEQARTMADAARRSPIMAFGSTGLASAPPSITTPSLAGDGQGEGDGQSAVAQRAFGVGGSGGASSDDLNKPPDKGVTDFSDQLGHAAIQTVRAGLVPDRSLLLSAGTIIPCTLQTAINSTQAGFVSCVINHDVFSENGRIVLLDKGTKVLGQYSGGITQGQARLFVLWTRALTPRGVAIDLGSPAADSLGRAGVPGGVDTQFWARFGVALVISVLEDASNIASRAVAGNGTNTTEVPSTEGQTVLQNTVNIRPILRKNQGDTASIFVAKDFDFRSVYDIQLRR